VSVMKTALTAEKNSAVGQPLSQRKHLGFIPTLPLLREGLDKANNDGTIHTVFLTHDQCHLIRCSRPPMNAPTAIFPS